jgi:1A family penicillin-binding protein
MRITVETIMINLKNRSRREGSLDDSIDTIIPTEEGKNDIINDMRISRKQGVFRWFSRLTFKNKILTLLGAGIVVGGLFLFLVFAWFARDLPAPGKLTQVNDSATIFYDRDGKVLFELYKDKNRLPVKGDEIPDLMKKATISIEDKDFYKHKGISESGLIRALLVSPLTGGGVQGGSTITQQLIKLVLLDSERTASRKIKEMILAIEIERRYSKDEILELYLNEIPYGGTMYGVGSAAKGYFGKSPSDLTLVEMAFLAGLPQLPSQYSPFIGAKDAWKYRTTAVLRRMREEGYITKKEELEALTKMNSLKFSTPKLSINAPHFVFYVQDLIEREYGVKLSGKGLRVYTTLSLEVQKIAEQIVKDEIEKLKGYQVGNGAAVVLDSKTGEVLAMVGSYDFNNDKYGKFNAALGLRQPGSTIKPITYATAFEKGYTPSTVVMDVQTTFPNQGSQEYKPVNYDGKFRGPTQLRFALGNSYNIPAVKVLALVGVKDFLRKAESMGLKTFAPTQQNINRFGLAITLGGGESTLLDMTGAFSVLARGGKSNDVLPIKEVKDRRGFTVYKPKRNSSQQVITSQASFLISHILSDNVARTDAFGPSSYLNIPGKTVAVKTGTTNDKRDNWTIGYTNDVTVGVWVGNNDNSPMNPRIASGITGASPIWSNIMKKLLTDKKLKYSDGIMKQPSGIKALIVDAYLGGLPKDGYPTRSEYFVDGTEPKDVSAFYKKLKISKSNGKLANDVEIRSGNYEEKDFIVITENDPVSSDNKNRWQEAIDAWVRDQAEKGNDKFKYPTESSDANADSVGVSIKSPGNESKVGSNFEVKAVFSSMEKIKNVKIYANGVEKVNIDGDNKDITRSITLDKGTYEIKVVAKNEKDKSGEASVKIGVDMSWNEAPTGVPTGVPTATPTPTPALP